MPVGDWRRYLAPLAFLVAVTIAVILIRAGLESGNGSGAAANGRTTTSAIVSKRFWTVRAGDTFGVIARETHTTVAAIEHLNPQATSTSLFVGEKIRVR